MTANDWLYIIGLAFMLGLCSGYVICWRNNRNNIHTIMVLQGAIENAISNGNLSVEVIAYLRKQVRVAFEGFK